MRSAVLVLFVAALTAGCASVNPRPDQAALGYTGGPIQGTHFKEAYTPGSGLHWLGIFDQYFLYPTTVRTYIVSGESTEGDKANVDRIWATTKDGVQIGWELAITFKLNTSRLRKFHEQIGLTRHAYFSNDEASEGWKHTLNDFFRQQIEAALQAVSREFSVDEVHRGQDTFSKVNKALGDSLQNRINDSAGGNFFCGPTFSGPVAEDDATVPCPQMQVAIKRVTLPEGVVRSYENQKVAENAKITAEREGEATRARADAEVNAQQKLREAYSDPGYIEYLNARARQTCAEHPPCLMGAGTGANLTIPAR